MHYLNMVTILRPNLLIARADLSQLSSDERAVVASVEDLHVIEHVIDINFDNLSVGT